MSATIILQYQSAFAQIERLVAAANGLAATTLFEAGKVCLLDNEEVISHYEALTTSLYNIEIPFPRTKENKS